MDPQVNRAARPEMARSQSKTTLPFSAKLTYAIGPKMITKRTENRGRPERSMYEKIFGA
jgi:hypothetical protein